MEGCYCGCAQGRRRPAALRCAKYPNMLALGAVSCAKRACNRRRNSGSGSHYHANRVLNAPATSRAALSRAISRKFRNFKIARFSSAANCGETPPAWPVRVVALRRRRFAEIPQHDATRFSLTTLCCSVPAAASRHCTRGSREAYASIASATLQVRLANQKIAACISRCTSFVNPTMWSGKFHLRREMFRQLLVAPANPIN